MMVGIKVLDRCSIRCNRGSMIAHCLRCCYERNATRLEDAFYFSNSGMDIRNMFKRLVEHDAVQRVVRQTAIPRIPHDICLTIRKGIKTDVFTRKVCGVRFVATTDIKHYGVLVEARREILHNLLYGFARKVVTGEEGNHKGRSLENTFSYLAIIALRENLSTVL